jgi:hypothetical protein
MTTAQGGVPIEFESVRGLSDFKGMTGPQIRAHMSKWERQAKGLSLLAVDSILEIVYSGPDTESAINAKKAAVDAEYSKIDKENKSQVCRTVPGLEEYQLLALGQSSLVTEVYFWVCSCLMLTVQ